MEESQLIRGFLSLMERCDQTQDVDLTGDVLLCVASAEPRCVEITRVRKCSYASTLLIDFDTRRSSGRKERFRSELAAFLSIGAEKLSILDGAGINEFNHWTEQLRENLLTRRIEAGHPLRVTVDVSCLPKHYLIYIIGLCVHEALISELQLVYAEGIYLSVGPHQPSDSANIYKFSEGRWSSVVIPYFEGILPIERQTRMVASLGFEGLQSRNFINAYQADKYAVILPSQASNQTYDAIADRESRALRAEICLPEQHIWKCKPTSAREVLEALGQGAEQNHRYQDIFVCLGTKPHAIGMALYALSEGEATVVCRMPATYPENATGSSGVFFRYIVSDLSSLPSLSECAELEHA